MKEAFLIGAYPNNQEKLDTLENLLKTLRDYELPIVLSTHYLCPTYIQELCDFYIYDKNNLFDERLRLDHFYHIEEHGLHIISPWEAPYHGLALITAVQNGVDFCKGRFSFIYYQEYDAFLNYSLYLAKVRQMNKPINFFRWKHDETALATHIFAMRLDKFYELFGTIRTADDYIKMMNYAKGENGTPCMIIEGIVSRLLNITRLFKETYIFTDEESQEMILNLSSHVAEVKHLEHKIYLCSVTDPSKIFLIMINESGVVEEASIKGININTTFMMQGNTRIHWYLLDNEGTLEVKIGNKFKSYELGNIKYNEAKFNFDSGFIVQDRS